ncbi:MAG TPA: zinc ribbon domain-containing protein [Gemmatimonadaceae bacterium]|nr:zinc ribbon domain-containing protein [Gemmatimonadaceae bacterium]
MDNLDRMYRHLVRTIRSRFPQHLTDSFTVAELHQTILPYRLHRRELGLDTNEDYEITLTELLAGTRDYLIVDDQMREALRKQLSMPNPDPSAYKQFGAATVTLAPKALHSLAIGPDEDSLTRGSSSSAASPAPTAAAAPRPAQASRTSSASSVPATASSPRPSGATAAPRASGPPITSPSGVRRVTPEAGDHCRSCGETLPVGRPITFCPHCGQNLTTMNCLGCGSELEVGWKFCPTCGRPAATT